MNNCASLHGNRRVVDARRGQSRDRAKVPDGGSVVVQQEPHGDSVDLVVVAVGRPSEEGGELADALGRNGSQMERYGIALSAERGCTFAREDAIEFEQTR